MRWLVTDTPSTTATSHPAGTALDRALAYASYGVLVFPCVPGGKTPLTHNGFHDATTESAAITAWWTRYPNANIATPTGAPGIDVLEVDVRPDRSGWAMFNKAKRAGLLQGGYGPGRRPPAATRYADRGRGKYGMPRTGSWQAPGELMSVNPEI